MNRGAEGGASVKARGTPGERARTGWLGLASVLALILGAAAGLRPAAPDRPAAVADIRGGPLAPELGGRATFEAVRGGALVRVDLHGLPAYRSGTPPIGPHGFHIHAVGSCEVGDPQDPFLAAGGHYDPDGQPHGNHAGDLPVVFSHHGVARMAVYTSRFSPRDVVGRSVIIHENPDDFRTQPAGASGRRLGCGIIRAVP